MRCDCVYDCMVYVYECVLAGLPAVSTTARYTLMIGLGRDEYCHRRRGRRRRRTNAREQRQHAARDIQLAETRQMILNE